MRRRTFRMNFYNFGTIISHVCFHQAGRALGGFDLVVFFWDVQQFLLAFGAESECEKAGASLLLSRLSGREKERGKIAGGAGFKCRWRLVQAS